MICKLCGHKNPAENRFCGMCGNSLITDPVAEAAPLERRPPPEPHPEEPNPQPTAPPPPMTVYRGTLFGEALDSPRAHRRSPSPREQGISGPSFLGLNYLDEPPPRRRRGWALLILLVAIGTLIWLQFRQPIRTQVARLAAMVPRASEPAPEPKPGDDAASATAPQAAQDETPSSSDSKSPQPAESTPEAKPGAEDNPSAATNPKAANQPNPDADRQRAARPNADPGQKDITPSQRPPEQEVSAAPPAGKPAPVDDSMLALAQKYLHGRGVRQSCEQALIYLRQAVQQPSSRARSQMGALYATGRCVPEDRVEAYRWFSAALEADPHNVWLERQRNNLYAHMSSDERQRTSR